MDTDPKALLHFARMGVKLFWLRQVMFIGATVITTTYLDSLVPILCYLVCLGAELAEVLMARRILAAGDLDRASRDRFVFAASLVALWSGLAVSAYGVIVAYLGEEAFLFVPLTYVFAAALYATIFNHTIRPVLIIRMVAYVAGFLTLGSLGLFTAPSDRQFLAFAIFFTTFSASFFFVMNAVVFRANYVMRRTREQALLDREARLRHEVEERVEAEMARQSSETRFKSLFESAPIPIREEDLSGMKRVIDALNLPDPADFEAYIDAHPEFLDACAREIVVVDANRASLAQHGYQDKSEMLAKVVRCLSPAAKKVVRRTVRTLHSGAPGASYETQITRADGDVRTVAATWTVMPGHETSYARILLCSVDLTERLAVEEALRQAQKMEAVGQLTGGVAHDFNNLLTVISGNMELLSAQGALDPDFADPIRKAVQSGAELTQRLLAFSRKQPLSARPVDLGDVVTGMMELLRRSLGDKNSISLDIAEHLWPAMADPGQVETALLNLALNARDAMPGGGTVAFACRNLSVPEPNDLDLAPGDYIVLSVKDSGTGMSPEVITRAFEPFFTTKAPGEGSGLGLSMIYGFAKQSGGTLQIASAPDQGTTLSIYLPRSAAAPINLPQPRPEGAVRDGQGQTILLLEDDQFVRDYLTRLMTTLGYAPLPASDAQDAKEILGSGQRIDLLISDVMLGGGLSGPDFAAELQASDPAVPVIFISGTPEGFEEATRKGGPDTAVLSKPFTRQAIAQSVQEALRRP